MTAPDLEAEYDNTGKVAGSKALVAHWAEQAASFRAAHAEAELGLDYGAGERERLDLFWPGPARDGPVTMFIHGGYWQALDRAGFSHLAAGPLAHGVAVAMPSYDLCPRVTLATIVGQVREAAAFLHRRHGRMLAVCGHSAGGHLAAMLLATEPRLVAAALPVSGIFDLEPLRHTSVNDALRLDAAEAHRLSPVFLPRPPGRLHAVVGGMEGAEYTRQTRSLAEAWDGNWSAMPGLNHFTVIERLADPASALVRQLLDCLPGARAGAMVRPDK